jgi:hypothetical protein
MLYCNNYLMRKSSYFADLRAFKHLFENASITLIRVDQLFDVIIQPMVR